MTTESANNSWNALSDEEVDELRELRKIFGKTAEEHVGDQSP